MPKRAANRLVIQSLRVAELCKAQGWSYRSLSHGAWISIETARKIYTGESRDPVLSNAIPIARTLGTYIEDLVVFEPSVVLPGTDVPRPPRLPQQQTSKLKVAYLRIRERCDQREWHADDLARLSGVNFSTVRGLYYGYTRDPTISTMLPLARTLANHVEELVVLEPLVEDV